MFLAANWHTKALHWAAAQALGEQAGVSRRGAGRGMGARLVSDSKLARKATGRERQRGAARKGGHKHRASSYC